MENENIINQYRKISVFFICFGIIFSIVGKFLLLTSSCETEISANAFQLITIIFAFTGMVYAFLLIQKVRAIGQVRGRLPQFIFISPFILSSIFIGFVTMYDFYEGYILKVNCIPFIHI